MKKNKEDRCLYKSNLNLSQCVLGSVLIMFISLPALWLSTDTLLYFLSWILLSALWWSICLRRSFFYDTHVVICFPFRFVKREVRIDYEDVCSFKFVDKSLSGDFLELIVDGSFFHKFYVKQLCSAKISSLNKHKRMKSFLLLKYLKSVGFLIETKNKSSNGLTYMEERIGLIFGSGNTNYVRKSPNERRKERKKNIVIIIITILFSMLLYILLDPFFPLRGS